MIKPANRKIRRFFCFTAVFRFYKTAQNLYGKIEVKNIRLKFFHRI